MGSPAVIENWASQVWASSTRVSPWIARSKGMPSTGTIVRLELLPPVILILVAASSGNTGVPPSGISCAKTVKIRKKRRPAVNRLRIEQLHGS